MADELEGQRGPRVLNGCEFLLHLELLDRDFDQLGDPLDVVVKFEGEKIGEGELRGLLEVLVGDDGELLPVAVSHRGGVELVDEGKHHGHVGDLGK